MSAELMAEVDRKLAVAVRTWFLGCHSTALAMIQVAIDEHEAAVALAEAGL